MHLHTDALTRVCPFYVQGQMALIKLDYEMFVSWTKPTNTSRESKQDKEMLKIEAVC